MDKELSPEEEFLNENLLLRSDFSESNFKVICKLLKEYGAKAVEEKEYWKKRCELAEQYIKYSPCDPDITKEQYKAYWKWHDFKQTS